jgi:hypothetical protein
MPIPADRAEEGLAERADQLHALLSRPALFQALHGALGTEATLRRLAGELAAEGGLGLTASDIEAPAET